MVHFPATATADCHAGGNGGGIVGNAGKEGKADPSL